MGLVLNLNALGNDKLFEQTHKVVCEERRVGAQVLKHLAEIEERGLHLSMGFGSMFELLVREFKYSAGAASRRARAARLLREVPALEASIQQGKVSITRECKKVCVTGF